MNELDLFRSIGESFAQANEFSGLGQIGERRVDLVANTFFTLATEKMYPKNKHKRAWSASNMHLGYVHECERMQIIDTLSGRTLGDAILAEIRRRNAEAKS